MANPDPISLTISALAFALAAGRFAWESRKTDSLACTLVQHDLKPDQATFQFSVSNLGTRAALLRELQVGPSPRPDFFVGRSSPAPGTDFPRIIKAGEMTSIAVIVASPFENLLRSMSKSGSHAEKPKLYLTASATAWNPKGAWLYGGSHFATVSLTDDRSKVFYSVVGQGTFRLTKKSPPGDFNRLGQALEESGEWVALKPNR